MLSSTPSRLIKLISLLCAVLLTVSASAAEDHHALARQCLSALKQADMIFERLHRIELEVQQLNQTTRQRDREFDLERTSLQIAQQNVRSCSGTYDRMYCASLQADYESRVNRYNSNVRAHANQVRSTGQRLGRERAELAAREPSAVSRANQTCDRTFGVEIPRDTWQHACAEYSFFDPGVRDFVQTICR
jgi:hypothetical protein